MKCVVVILIGAQICAILAVRIPESFQHNPSSPSCGSLINLIVNFFMGLSVGASVCAAQGIGAKNRDAVQKVVHTAVLAAVICGVFIATVGMIFAKPLLGLMGTDDAVIDQAARYMRAFFCGTPASMIYNYCAGILRSDGDTKHPLAFLTVAGIVNEIGRAHV